MTYQEPPVAGDETATLLGSLERQRATVAWKCGGLDADGLQATLGNSSITLGGLLKHLAHVEDHYFSVRLHNRSPLPLWRAEPDWVWSSAADDSPEELMQLWQDTVARSRALVAEALAEGGLDQLARRTWPDGRAPSLRRILIDLIEEYARHAGHADLLRESVDGLVGEDPPRYEKITARQFHEADGIDDWRVLFEGASAFFATGSFAAGVALVNAIGKLSDDANHHPDIDLRSEGVTVRLMTQEVGGVSDRDLLLAQQISVVAQELGVRADPAAVQTVQFTIDALVSAEVRPFWRAILGYQEKGSDDLIDARRRGPSMWFQGMKEPRPQRNRLHVDISVPHDHAKARVAAALAAGGHMVNDEHAPSWWVLADAEGNEACLATWMDRDQDEDQ